MKKVLAVTAAFLISASVSFAQVEGAANTQALVGLDSKSAEMPTISNLTMKVNGKQETLTGWSKVQPNGVQIAVLIDDGLRDSVGRELNSLKDFANNLPPGVQIFIGYMHNGTISVEQPFTTDHAAAAARFRLPFGSPGISASPYFCLSEFVKHWPGGNGSARFVMMITNGVDPYNGSTSITNQDSPYVQAAVTDAQRAGVAVSSIYYGDAGFRGGRASFSGQSYLTQVADETGGRAYFQGSGNPVSMAPFLAQFQHAISETYVASFPAKASGNRLADLKIESNVHGIKLPSTKEILPGNTEAPTVE